MKYFVIIALLFFTDNAGLWAQVRLDRQQCREMALENSKQMAIAGKEKEKAVYTLKSVRAGFSRDYRRPVLVFTIRKNIRTS